LEERKPYAALGTLVPDNRTDRWGFRFLGLEGMAMWIAKVLFVVFLILFVVSLVQGRRGPPVD